MAPLNYILGLLQTDATIAESFAASGILPGKIRQAIKGVGLLRPRQITPASYRAVCGDGHKMLVWRSTPNTSPWAIVPRGRYSEAEADLRREEQRLADIADKDDSDTRLMKLLRKTLAKTKVSLKTLVTAEVERYMLDDESSDDDPDDRETRSARFSDEVSDSEANASPDTT